MLSREFFCPAYDVSFPHQIKDQTAFTRQIRTERGAGCRMRGGKETDDDEDSNGHGLAYFYGSNRHYDPLPLCNGDRLPACGASDERGQHRPLCRSTDGSGQRGRSHAPGHQALGINRFSFPQRGMSSGGTRWIDFDMTDGL